MFVTRVATNGSMAGMAGMTGMTGMADVRGTNVLGKAIKIRLLSSDFMLCGGAVKLYLVHNRIFYP